MEHQLEKIKSRAATRTRDAFLRYVKEEYDLEEREDGGYIVKISPTTPDKIIVEIFGFYMVLMTTVLFLLSLKTVKVNIYMCIL